ncbi:MAG: phosphodiester glycosidase family protein [Herpetosiphonaceae bacterium]|nr:phosphodiester glycosidase family protein [Herpetosiphonaceae bacterium]
MHWWGRGCIVGLFGVATFTACSTEQLTQSAPTPVQLYAEVTSAPPTASASAWERVAAGLEFRAVRLAQNEHTGTFSTIRIDPERYHIRVAYDRQDPGTVRQWVDAVKPMALINGGYFDANYRATALVIFNGIVQGTSYDGFGGMVVVNPQGKFELRSLRQQPYDADERLQQAMQSTPMLIQPGGTVSELQADQDRSRRTVIARDRTGRILLMVDDQLTFTLPELGPALKQSDLDLDAALNLDGGRSSGMYLDRPGNPLLIEAFDKLPLVLVVDK